MTADYTSADRERWAAEDPVADRSEFARDRARVLHSAALRRLAAKTQVVMAGQADFPRTRLTHTLEVAQISRELGASLGADADVVDTAGLAHDLGHPPFGHNGEDALDQVCADIGGFEGNAQSLRVLTRLELKVFTDGRSLGLNLCRATLDATVKYPWLRRPGQRKFNVYADDASTFDWVRAGAPTGRRSFEAQVMDWADDVAYCVHDLEDAVHSRHFDPAGLQDPGLRAAIVAAAAVEYAPDTPRDRLAQAAQRLAGLDFWPAGYDGAPRAQAALKAMTSQLIRRFCRAAQVASRAAHAGPMRRFDADLVVPWQQRDEVAVLKAITYLFVMQRPGADQAYEHQQQVLQGVVISLLDTGADHLDPLFARLWEQADSDAGRLRAVVDQVASLTDVSVLRWHDRLCRHA